MKNEELLALLPCPFCGGEAEMDSRRAYAALASPHRVFDAVAIYCLGCSADMSEDPREAGVSRDDAIYAVRERWNTRAASPVAGAEAVATPDAIVARVYFHTIYGAFAVTKDGKEWRLSGEEITRALNAAPQAAMPSREWQPIETAPRDPAIQIIGTRFAFEGDKATCIKEPFISFWSPSLNKFFAGPTHWTALPAPPLSRISEQEGAGPDRGGATA